MNISNSSYSFINDHIYCNYAEIQDYKDAVQSGREPIKYAKKVTGREAMSRYFVLGIKFLKVRRQPFIEIFGVEPELIFGEIFDRLYENDMLTLEGDEYKLTRKGRYYVNNVCKEFYVDSAKGAKQYIQFVPTLTSNQIDYYMDKFKKNLS